MGEYRDQLKEVRTFPSLIRFLRDELDWPIETDNFDDLTFEYTPEELGIDADSAAKIEEIKRLRPLVPSQPWGIFFVKFEPKRLPVVVLRRILSRVALKKRASANSAERAAWAPDDLLFVSNYGEGDMRQISFAHFSAAPDGHDLPTLKVLGWDSLDTALHIDAVAKELTEHLAWPDDDADLDAWRKSWRAAFTLRHREVISTSRDLSVRLADLARAIRGRIVAALDIETDRGPLTQLMKAFQGALVHDLDADGFADMYAQTIAYGLLSARMADPAHKTVDDLAGHMRTNPFLRELMETFLHIGGRRGRARGAGIDFDELGVSEVVEMLDDANMEAIVRDFGDRNPLEDPVMHFYELFLAKYDPDKRLTRGVFYTPRPIVAAMVSGVHASLRDEKGIPDGLADPSISILDPAVGTGTFLVEAIALIHRILAEKWRAEGATAETIRSRWNDYVPLHLLPRLYGFELMMAPYAIAHMKIGLKLQETGYDFHSQARVNVVLTNSLEPGAGEAEQLAMLVPALADEARVAAEAKSGRRFSVVIGNPPYKNNSDVTLAQVAERFPRLLETSRLEAQVQTRNIRDDYAWFYAAADAYCDEEMGIVCLVTSDSYARLESYRHFRRALLTEYRIHGLLRIGRSVFRDVSPRISFAVMELLRRDPGAEASDLGLGINVTDIRPLADGLRPSQLATPADPRLQLLSEVAEGRKTLPPPVAHEPIETRQWSFVPLGPTLVDRVLSDSVPIFRRGGGGIFVEKWPGIITAFDGLLKARDEYVLRERMESFFDACYAPESRRQRVLDQWAASHEIGDRWLGRLGHVAHEIVRAGVTYSAANVKRSVSGSIPNHLRWYPPPAYRHYIYYEPRIKIPRNVNPGRFEGWGSMEQWRDPASHLISPKLIYTTSTNPRSGYKAFVVDDEWFVKLHGGTSQQYNFTGLAVGSRAQRLEGGPNNLSAVGARMLEPFRASGLEDESLLHLIAGIYNSDLAERFLAEESGSPLQIRIPSDASGEVSVQLTAQARRMRNLHQLLYDGSCEDFGGEIDAVAGLAIADDRVVFGPSTDEATVRAELELRIASEQEYLDQLVETYYGAE